MTTTSVARLDGPAVKGYVAAGGLNTYYEATGTGEALVMLHGGFATVETFSGLTPMIADRYRVFSPERRGHGRMPDIDGPITYEIMAQDTVAFLEAIAVGPVHLVGWSDGANVAMQTALYRPDLIRKLILIGTSVNVRGGAPWAQAMAEHMTVDHLPPMLIDAYAALSPDGRDHFPVVFDKLSAAIARTTLELPDLERIPAPTLVMLGDDDLVTIEHADAMRRTLPDGQLAVVPGASHGLPLERPELVTRLIFDFLSDAHPTKLMPSPPMK